MIDNNELLDFLSRVPSDVQVVGDSCRAETLSYTKKQQFWLQFLKCEDLLFFVFYYKKLNIHVPLMSHFSQQYYMSSV